MIALAVLGQGDTVALPNGAYLLGAKGKTVTFKRVSPSSKRGHVYLWSKPVRLLSPQFRGKTLIPRLFEETKSASLVASNSEIDHRGRVVRIGLSERHESQLPRRAAATCMHLADRVGYEDTGRNGQNGNKDECK